MTIRSHWPVLALILLLPLASCRQKKDVVVPAPEATEEPGRAVYFWKTRFDINESEQEFLKTYSIGKMYVRMFDVDYDASPAAGAEKVIPVGTTSFVSGKPDGIEIIPTVFITTRALDLSKQEEGGLPALAGKIVLRVGNMMDYNELGAFRELQLDCDWTESTQEDFFALCRQVKALLRADKRDLSVTVRLHQLRQQAPPADRGVLMLYNTGALRAAGRQNSILDISGVKAYLSKSPVVYGIPLDFAYPSFGWGVWFRGSKYKGLLHQTDFSNTEYYSSDGNEFTVLKDHVLERHELQKGDKIRLETSDPASIKEVKDLVRKSFYKNPHTNILYHLDSNNLSKYTKDEIQSILAD